jgi:hypothetical protein
VFELAHPGPTGRGGRRYPVLGVDRPGDPDDANYRQCGQCGFPVLLGRDQQGPSLDSPGLALTQTAVAINPGQGGGVVIKSEMVVQSGCPFCGTYNAQLFNKSRPYSVRDPYTSRHR